MDSGKLGLAGLLVMVGLGLGHGYEIVSKNQHFVVAPEDQVVLTCTVSGSDFNIFKTGFRFMKGEHEVSTNEMIKEPFKSTNRYQSVLGGPNNNEVNLTIEGVTAAEHDVYHCLVEDKIVVNYTVDIPEEVESVALTTNTSHVNGQKVFKFEADKPAFVQCEVKGGRPKPYVTIHRNGDEDITDQFENPFKSTTEDKQQKEPLEVTTHHLILRNGSFLMSTDFNGQNLTCKANVPVNKARAAELGLTSLKKFDTALMEITYAPKFDCDTEKETVEGTKQFRIECVVKANPPIDMQEIVWSFGKGDNDTTHIKHVKNQMFEDGQYETFAEDSESNVRVILEIKNVNSSDFKSYTLQVKNDLGTEEHIINVFRKTTTLSTTTSLPTNPGGDIAEIRDDESAARKTVATIFSLVISIILATLV